MIKQAVTALANVALIALSVAHASTLTNRDDKDHKVTVIEAKSTKDQQLRPSATLKGICSKGCVIRLDDKDDSEYELNGSEVVSIEDGYLYYDEAPGAQVPAAGDADAPSQPGAE